ncbi:KipI antagonist [Streptomyces sp. YIM 130001]|uniref:5-oxoprolinase subunit C family protein n=1 Tax=Streptomyces sp. YIM 130001 TaxID=2259644 RepID=UPI000E6533E4|nr:biotin-dependent carboxyltransferase family protein [Streptomyces sp. YIM 130001]RII14008.1 KipI antagonist [Streptomyces sp. YIM 130001]
MTRGLLDVVRAGALTTVQDAGRPGHAHLGVPHSGALDQPASRLANRLVGNHFEAAVLETTLDGCSVRPRRTVLAAVTGAPCPVKVDGRPAPWGAWVRVPAGALLEVGPAVRGIRSYVAFAGGIDVEPELGSRATDRLSGLGPPALTAGDTLALGPPSALPPPLVEAVPHRAPPAHLVLRIAPGPRADWFTPAALRLLTAARYVVSAGDRVGLRLHGPVLARRTPAELPSEGVVLGAVQVPPDGQPLVFLADHPVTGGYPVIAIVDRRDLPDAAQAVAGVPVRFVQSSSWGQRY